MVFRGERFGAGVRSWGFKVGSLGVRTGVGVGVGVGA